MIHSPFSAVGAGRHALLPLLGRWPQGLCNGARGNSGSWTKWYRRRWPFFFRYDGPGTRRHFWVPIFFLFRAQAFRFFFFLLYWSDLARLFFFFLPPAAVSNRQDHVTFLAGVGTPEDGFLGRFFPGSATHRHVLPSVRRRTPPPSFSSFLLLSGDAEESALTLSPLCWTETGQYSVHRPLFFPTCR